eukprot:gene25706-11364_t
MGSPTTCIFLLARLLCACTLLPASAWSAKNSLGRSLLEASSEVSDSSKLLGATAQGSEGSKAWQDLMDISGHSNGRRRRVMQWPIMPPHQTVGRPFLIPDRERSALSRYHNGKNLTVAVIGGSIAAGADIVILDYSLNDADPPKPPFNNAMRRPFERLLRKLLNYPNKPAIVLLNAYGFLWGLPEEQGLYYSHTSDPDFGEFASYYRLQSLSVKAATYHLMKQGVKGFNISRPRSVEGAIDVGNDDSLRENMFYYDRVHPDGWTGHLAMAELVVQMIMETEADLVVNPLTALDGLDAVSPLPDPIITNNYESVRGVLVTGDQFKVTVSNNVGWEWKSDSPDPERPKYGFITETPESVLTLKLNTMTPSFTLDKQTLADMVIIEIAYLKSYRKMGRALVKCESGCICSITSFDGHHDAKTSLLNLHEMKVSQHEECIMTITSMAATTSGTKATTSGTKVKVSGVMISDEGGKFTRPFGEIATTNKHMFILHNRASFVAPHGQRSSSLAAPAPHGQRLSVRNVSPRTWGPSPSQSCRSSLIARATDPDAPEGENKPLSNEEAARRAAQKAKLPGGSVNLFDPALTPGDRVPFAMPKPNLEGEGSRTWTTGRLSIVARLPRLAWDPCAEERVCWYG